MAAPPEVTMKDLTGNWVMNKSLSDDTDALLALQGIGWLTRKAIALSTVYLSCKQYTTDGVTHIDIEQTATGGIKGTSENRTLDWTFREHKDHIFGNLNGKNRWVTLAQVEDDFLKEEWLEGDEEKAGPEGEKHVQSYVKNEGSGWTAEQIWGFSLIDGKRYYTRRVTVIKGDKVMKVRLVYNWTGK